MTTAPLLVGIIFWTSLTFLGFRRAFTSGSGPLYEPFFRLKKRAPLLFWAGTGGGFALALVFLFLEHTAISQRAGLIGPFFGLAVIFGIIGSVSLAAQVYLED